jgi:phosphate/sulfate permease
MPPSICEPHWAQIVSWLSTPLVALVAALFGVYIAYRQWKTAQDRLKFDLFDRRFVVYDTARNFLSSIITYGDIKHEEVSKFIIGTSESKWLFDDKVDNYLRNEIGNKINRFTTLKSTVESLSSKEDRNENIMQQSQLLTWFIKQPTVLVQKFEPFLKLKH